MVNKPKLNLDKAEILWVNRKTDLGLESSLVWGHSALEKPGSQLGSATEHSGHLRKPDGCGDSVCFC